MQNVLIDDRRIHVDFSQSVSKLHNAWIHDRSGRLGAGGFGGFGGSLRRKEQYRSSDVHAYQTDKYELLMDDSAQPKQDIERTMDRNDSNRRHRDSDRRRNSRDRHRRDSASRRNSKDRHRRDSDRHYRSDYYEIDRSGSRNRRRSSRSPRPRDTKY